MTEDYLRYFDTKEEAEIFLEQRRTESINRIKERGDTIIADKSHVYQKFIWEKYGEYSMHETNIMKWFTFLEIYTQQMIDDLKAMNPLDYDAELKEIENYND